MHRLVKKEKSLFTTGTLKIAKLEGNAEPVYFLNLNSFYYSLSKGLVFIKLIYEDTVSYLFPHFDNGFSSITVDKASLAIYNFD